MAENNDVFQMLVVEDRLDGKNYPLWAYMMHHVLVATGLWNVTKGIEKVHVVANAGMNAEGTDSIEDVDFPIHAHVTVSVVPNVEQLRCDGKDA